MLEIEKEFNLQLFADEEYSVDEALAMMDGTVEVTPDEVETDVAPVEEVANEPVTEEVEQETDPVVEETPAVDYNLKVKFKANGQEQEKTIQDLINEAQLGSNYNQKMQELAQQRKAFEMANQQALTQKQETPADKLAKREQQFAEYAPRFEKEFGVEFNQFDPAHLIEMVEHYNEERELKKSADYEQQQHQIVEESYYSTVNNFSAEPDFVDVNKFAIDSLFQLPQKGPEGVKEFQKLYGIYQKTQLREQHWQETQQYGRSNVKLVPFTPTEVKELEKFYNGCKAEYHAKQVKTQVKAQVPKSVPIRPTVKTESVGTNEPQSPRKLDMKKIQNMSLDEVARLLK